MQSSSIQSVQVQLELLVKNSIQTAVMIWGSPGIGKSSIVQQIGKKFGLEVIDLRISQLAPTDLRGLPVAKDGISTWYPPEFLPTKGKGILFLDELNMATPSVMGIAQQLILDRKVGNYSVPDGWFIWAAGNTAKDKAAVYNMSQPLANRFLHFQVSSSLQDFRNYGLQFGIHPLILAFLEMRTELLHAPDNSHAWPSPRTWEFASQLLNANLPIESAVGIAASIEFESYLEIQDRIPDVNEIITGNGSQILFPEEPSLKFALTTSIAAQIKEPMEAFYALDWMVKKADKEFVVLFKQDLKAWLNRISSEKRKELIKAMASSSEFKLMFQELVKFNIETEKLFND